MRLAFMGSPDFAVPALRALAGAGHDIAAVYTQPPRPAHRGQALTKCAVQQAAEALGLRVRTPEKLRGNPEEHEAFRALGLDAAVVAAFGQILPQTMLDAPRLGCINIHASLLPRWRGAAPIQAAILAGDPETGITIMRMEAGLDTGPMLLKAAVPIGPRDTTPDLQHRLATLGATSILEALQRQPQPEPQPENGATYAAKLSREDGRLDFATQDAATLDRKIRAFTPWPAGFAQFADATLKILAAEPANGEGLPGAILDDTFRVACRRGALRLLRVQRPGRPAMDGEALLRGIPHWRELRLS